MKTLIATLLAVCLATAGFGGAVAQETEASYGSGMDSPVTWSDDRGNVLATMQVATLNVDWQDFADGDGPNRGFVYQLVTFSVTSVSDAEIELRSNEFGMVDGYGRWLNPVHVSVADDAAYELFNGSVPLAAGETSEQMLAFETPMDVPAGLFVWQHGNNNSAMVNIGDSGIDNGAIAEGLNTPSTWTDDRENVIATFQVTDVNPDWLDYAENYEPDRGSVYQAVHFTITNESDDVVVVNPSTFLLLDNSGVNLRLARPNVAEGVVQEVFVEGVELAPGDAVDGMLVFLNFTDLEPTALLWQPENGLMNVVVVQDGDAPSDGSDAEATPAG